MKTYNLILIFSFCLLHLYAENRSYSEIEQIANEFVYGSPNIKDISGMTKPLRCVKKSTSYCIFVQDSSYVIVSSNKGLPKILGYNRKQSFDMQNMSPALKNLLDQYDYKASHLSKTTIYNASSGSNEFVKPLLAGNNWTQNAPFNLKCPLVGEEHAVVGCVATAVAQVMSYHKYPKIGTGIRHSYMTYSLKLNVHSDFNTTYDWDNILTHYDRSETMKQNMAVSQFCFDVGVACNMNYGIDQSGANINNILEGLPKYLNYDKDISLLRRESYSFEEWMRILKNELLKNRPFFYCINGKYGGHACMCDGFDGDLFHINWGWTSLNGGYYYLDGMYSNDNFSKIGVDEGLNYYQIAGLGIHPPDNIDGLDMINCLMYSDFDFSKMDFDKTANVLVQFPYIFNKSNFFNGDINVKVNNIATNKATKIGYLNSVHIAAGDSIYNCDIPLDFSNLDDGEYLMTFNENYSKISSTYSLRNALSHCPDSVSFVIKDGLVSIAKLESAKCSIKCDTVCINNAKNMIYSDGQTAINFKLINQSNFDFYSEYCLVLKRKDKSQIIKQNIVNIAAHGVFNFDSKLYFPKMTEEKVILEVYYNEHNDAYHVDGFDKMRKIYSRTVKIGSDPNGKTDIHMNGPIFFDKYSPQHINERHALINIPLVNTGGASFDVIEIRIFDYFTKKIVYRDRVLVSLDFLETDTIVCNYNYLDLKDKGLYKITVYENQNGFLKGLKPIEQSKLDFIWHKVHTGIDLNTEMGIEIAQMVLYNSNSLELSVYNVNGVLMLQSKAKEIDLSSLIPGIYLIKTPTHVIKYVK